MIPLRSSERVFSRSVVTGSLIAINVLIFLYELMMGPRQLAIFTAQWAIVPNHLHVSSLFTSMFLHAGWLHLGGNMLFLWVFGRSIEDLIGSSRFLIFYLLCGLAAGVVHVIVNPYSHLPTVGASGAIAGVMGAYLVKFPRSDIDTLIFFGLVFRFAIPAPFLLLWWFAMQFFQGVMSLGEPANTGGIAVFAHIGGFIAGMLLIRIFPAKQRWRNWYDAD